MENLAVSKGALRKRSCEETYGTAFLLKFSIYRPVTFIEAKIKDELIIIQLSGIFLHNFHSKVIRLNLNISHRCCVYNLQFTILT